MEKLHISYAELGIVSSQRLFSFQILLPSFLDGHAYKLKEIEIVIISILTLNLLSLNCHFKKDILYTMTVLHVDV